MGTEILDQTKSGGPLLEGGELLIPTVQAKHGSAEAPPAGFGLGGKDHQNAAEIERLSGWAIATDGEPILAD